MVIGLQTGDETSWHDYLVDALLFNVGDVQGVTGGVSWSSTSITSSNGFVGPTAAPGFASRPPP